MKIIQIAGKASSIAVIAAAMLAVSGQVSADDDTHLLWAGHFTEAYKGTSQQLGGSIARSNTGSGIQDAPVWAGHFQRAYGPSSARIGVVTGPGRQDASEHLLWAGNFKQAYQMPREGAVDQIGAIEVAMERN